MNPIEHLWDALGRRLAVLNPPSQTLAELATVLQEQWLSLPMELIDRIIENYAVPIHYNIWTPIYYKAKTKFCMSVCKSICVRAENLVQRYWRE